MIDYLYVTIEGSHKPLDTHQIALQYDDHYFANSSLEISNKDVRNNYGRYTIEIKYRCKQYGGTLIDYELDLNIPECG